MYIWLTLNKLLLTYLLTGSLWEGVVVAGKEGKTFARHQDDVGVCGFEECTGSVKESNRGCMPMFAEVEEGMQDVASWRSF